MDYPLKVSVLVVTYNHEKFIREAIESILMQKHDFNMEIVIADDYSTDGTLSIIKEYQAKYPELFKILMSTGNVGITQNYKRGFQSCEGEYIAVLEGDDYWTSPKRLSKMIQFLDNNKGCSMAFNRFIVDDMKTRRFNIQPWPVNGEYQLITVSDLVVDNIIGNFSTCIYRNEIVRKIPESLFDMKVYDWMYNIVTAQFGLIAYIPEVMSVYRLHVNGTWTQKTQEEKNSDIIASIDQYNKYLNYVYDSEFQQHKSRIANSSSSAQSELVKRSSVKSLIKNYTPPFVWIIAKAIIPPKAIDILKRNR